MTQGEEGETDRKHHRQAERGWRAATVSREGRHRRGNLARRWKDENASSKESPVSPRHQEKAAERLYPSEIQTTSELYPREIQTRRQDDEGASGLGSTQKSQRH